MKTYELLIAEQQPTCGGQLPVKQTIKTVSTDDPVAYVKELEHGAELEVSTLEDGTVVVEADHNGRWIKYEFTED